MSVRKLPYYAQMRASPTITRDRVTIHDPASAGDPKNFHTSLQRITLIKDLFAPPPPLQVLQYFLLKRPMVAFVLRAGRQGAVDSTVKREYTQKGYM